MGDAFGAASLPVTTSRTEVHFLDEIPVLRFWHFQYPFDFDIPSCSTARSLDWLEPCLFICNGLLGFLFCRRRSDFFW
ncbi:hypothetical protein D3C77_250110 [compost metagenome]